MHNAKSREHAHTCRKAAIFKLRYKNKKTCVCRHNLHLERVDASHNERIFDMYFVQVFVKLPNGPGWKGDSALRILS